MKKKMVIEVAMDGQINYRFKMFYNIIIFVSMKALGYFLKKKLIVDGSKSRINAMKVAAGLPGVESTALKGDDKSQIEVTGVGVHPVKLTRLLRNKVGYAKLLSVSDPDPDKKPEEKKSEENEWKPLQLDYNPYCQIYHIEY